MKQFALCTAMLVLALSLSSCGKPEASSQGSASNPESTAAASESSAESIDRSKITLRVIAPANVVEYPQGTDENNNPFIELLREKTGYNFDWSITPKEDATTKLNIMFTSGDAPDLLIGYRSTYLEFVDKDLLAPLNTSLDKYGTHLKELVEEELWGTVTYGGKIYAVPNPEHQMEYKEGFAFHGGPALMYRADVLKELGLEPPTTTEELYTVLKTIDEKTDYLPYAAADAPLGYLSGVISAFGIANTYSVEDGKVVNNWLTEKGRKAITYLEQLYGEGLIDPEYPFLKSANVVEKITSNQAVFTSVGIYDAANWEKALLQSNANAEISYTVPLTGPDGYSGQSRSSLSGLHFMVPYSSKYTDAVIDLMNLYTSDEELVSAIEYGFEGTDYTVENGLKVATPEAAQQSGYRIYYKLWATREAHQTNVKLKGFEPMLLKQGGQGTVVDIRTYMPPISALARKGTDTTDVFNEYLTKIITGALPLSDYDTFMTKYKEAGMDEILAEMNEWYETDGKNVYQPQ